MDAIRLRGLQFMGRHGVHAAEKRLGQRFVVDVDMAVPPRVVNAAAATDAVEATVDYSKVYHVVAGVMEAGNTISDHDHDNNSADGSGAGKWKRRNLIETLAVDIAEGILARPECAVVEAVTVTVTKPQVQLMGIILERDGAGASVVIHRHRRRPL